MREEAKKTVADRATFYEKLPDKPELMSKEEFINSNKEDCMSTISRCSGFICENMKSTKRMKKQDEATHKLFESLKIFDKEV